MRVLCCAPGCKRETPSARDRLCLMCKTKNAAIRNGSATPRPPAPVVRQAPASPPPTSEKPVRKPESGTRSTFHEPSRRPLPLPRADGEPGARTVGHVTAYLSQEAYDALRAASVAEGTNASAVIRRALLNYVPRKEVAR